MDRDGCFKRNYSCPAGKRGLRAAIFTMRLPLAEPDKRIDKFCGGVYKIDKAAETG